MQIRTARDIGAAIRDRRRKKGLDQAGLAALVGVSRQWIIHVEKGKPHADLSLVLKTFDALGITLHMDGSGTREPESGPAVDIDAIITGARGKKR